VLFRIGFHQLRLACLRIEQSQGHKISVCAFVGLKVNKLAIFLEAHRHTAFKDAARINFGELVRINAQNLVITIFRRARSQPQIACQIKVPPGYPLRVLTYQRLFTGRDLELVEIVPCLVAIIQTDVGYVWLVFGQ
jgi:hypothetical protein